MFWCLYQLPEVGQKHKISQIKFRLSHNFNGGFTNNGINIYYKVKLNFVCLVFWWIHIWISIAKLTHFLRNKVIRSN